jgi:asparagine synthase (glutamine-hydrolysing)
MREVESGTIVTVTTNGVRTTRCWTLQTHEHTDDGVGWQD